MSQIHGHEKTREALARLLATERLPATLLFHGLDGIGKKLIAQDFAKKLAGLEDIRNFAPEAKSGYLIETIKQITAEAMQTPYNSPHKILILDNAHKMLPAHANALLKTLEEPLPTTHFILITDKQDKLLPTIRSRSFALKFQPLQNLPGLHAKLACGSLGRQKRLEQNDLYTRFLSWIMAPDFTSSQEAIATFDESEIPDILHLYLLWIRDLESGISTHFDSDLIAPYKNQNFPTFETAIKRVAKMENAQLYNVKWQALLKCLREANNLLVNFN